MDKDLNKMVAFVYRRGLSSREDVVVKSGVTHSSYQESAMDLNKFGMQSYVFYFQMV